MPSVLTDTQSSIIGWICWERNYHIFKWESHQRLPQPNTYFKKISFNFSQSPKFLINCGKDWWRYSSARNRADTYLKSLMFLFTKHSFVILFLTTLKTVILHPKPDLKPPTKYSIKEVVGWLTNNNNACCASRAGGWTNSYFSCFEHHFCMKKF